jgi:hypothetical protein
MTRCTRGAALPYVALAIAASAIVAHAAEPVPLPQAHAHNDYVHARPLLDALDHGFCSIEADIWRLGEALLVGHAAAELTPERTLEALYLKPLADRIAAHNGWVYQRDVPVTLLIDIKSDGAATYSLLRTQLAKYSHLFRPRVATGEATAGPPVVVIISGNRPIEVLAAEADRLCGVDGRLADLSSDLTAELVPLISDAWPAHFRWLGAGPMPDDERQRLRGFVDAAHARGQRLRFWATPDDEAVWAELTAAGVDLIGADDLGQLRRFLMPAPAAEGP